MTDKSRSSLTLVAVALSMAACIVSLTSYVRLRTAADTTVERVYLRMASEIATELEPVYQDFGITVPHDPKTIREAIRPLLSITQSLAAPDLSSDGPKGPMEKR